MLDQVLRIFKTTDWKLLLEWKKVGEPEDIVRVQKRLLHLIAQNIELSMCNGMVELSALPYQMAAARGDTYKVTAQVRLDPTFSRTQAANVIRSELIRRFLAKPSGFVCGRRHADNKDLLGATANNNVGTQAAAQYITAYMILAQQALLHKFAKQKYHHLSYYHDASKVCTFVAWCQVVKFMWLQAL